MGTPRSQFSNEEVIMARIRIEDLPPEPTSEDQELGERELAAVAGGTTLSLATSTATQYQYKMITLVTNPVALPLPGGSLNPGGSVFGVRG
jgi:hypothetical protein